MDILTKRQREVLTKMRDEDEELVYCSGRAYVDLEPVSKSVVFSLIRLMAVRMDQFSTVGECERYTINETGRALLDADSRK